MSSVLPGFEYDIFISYRQKDNKGDGWVTEFVESLKTELEATFKEDISVYFDFNPHDGLLETHDVAASLKEKLKALIFIPVVSRTYCDPKCYAWEHEFIAFIEQASQDPFGLKIKLPNHNIASRVLPVRINDLDIGDMKLCESLLGGVLRSIDFIYKSPGVNRPLRSKEENQHDNLNHTIYRDQINKVALAIKDIIESMKVSNSSAQGSEKSLKEQEIPGNRELMIDEPAKAIKPRQKEDVEESKPVKGKRVRFSNLKAHVWIPGVLLIMALITVIALILNHSSGVKWAKETALPQIEQLANGFNFDGAYHLSRKAEKYLSKDPKFKELASSLIKRLTILTDPAGADVSIREYSDTAGAWREIGKTPLDSIVMPKHSFYLMKINKTGFDEILAVMPTRLDTIYRKLFRKGTIPSGMIYVEGNENNGYFLDKHEVTNKHFKDFVDNGGYSKPEYWKHNFIKDGKELKWEEAIAEFTDKTGRPGPSTWEAGDFPDGQDDYPVSGVSWYEAAAYAEYSGKDLPTNYHWIIGTGVLVNYSLYFFSKILPFSNFSGKGPEPVGKNPGMNSFGAFDMAGNVREWCSNETPGGRIIRGGGWDDAIYMYSELSQLPPFDRSPKNGFRCVQYIHKEKIPEFAFQPIEWKENRDFSKEKPVPDNIFEIYRNQFLYDSTDLKGKVLIRDSTPEDWIIEKVSYTAAYDHEQVVAFLYLPKKTKPPFQTMIFFPGSYAQTEKDLLKNSWANWFTDYILKSGRAVMYPVYKGTYERNDGLDIPPRQSRQYLSWLIKWVQDFKRSVDYLKTRPEIDTCKLGYYGHSWGAELGGIIPAVDSRLKVSVLVVGGFAGQPFPEADELNYVPRIRIPVLMLNGDYDMAFPMETAVKPFFNLLGTPAKDKYLKRFETDHGVPKTEMIKETLSFLDQYLGPVK